MYANIEYVAYYKRMRDEGFALYSERMHTGVARLVRRFGQHGLDALADALED